MTCPRCLIRGFTVTCLSIRHLIEQYPVLYGYLGDIQIQTLPYLGFQKMECVIPMDSQSKNTNPDYQFVKNPWICNCASVDTLVIRGYPSITRNNTAIHGSDSANRFNGVQKSTYSHLTNVIYERCKWSDSLYILQLVHNVNDSDLQIYIYIYILQEQNQYKREHQHTANFTLKGANERIFASLRHVVSLQANRETRFGISGCTEMSHDLFDQPPLSQLE